MLRFPEKNPLSWDSGNDIGLDGGGAIVPRMCMALQCVANLRMMIKSVTNDTSSVCLLCFEHKSICICNSGELKKLFEVSYLVPRRRTDCNCHVENPLRKKSFFLPSLFQPPTAFSKRRQISFKNALHKKYVKNTAHLLADGYGVVVITLQLFCMLNWSAQKIITYIKWKGFSLQQTGHHMMREMIKLHEKVCSKNMWALERKELYRIRGPP